MVTRRYQRDYQKLNLHKTIQWSQEDTKEIIEPKSTHRQYNGHKKIPKRLSEPKSTHRQYNGHKKIPKRLSEPKSTQDNTMVTRRHQRDYQNLNLHKTIQWSQEDTKEIIRT
jgi:hypothetical protein